MSIANRVRAGALTLDRCRPGWADTIDPGRIDLLNPAACILALTYGTFHSGLAALQMSWFQAIQYGFAPRMSMLEEDPTREAEALTAAWRFEIRRRVIAEVA